MVAMVGVILLSLLGLSQGDMDPGAAAQTTIRQEISSGVDADNIIFKKRDVGGAATGAKFIVKVTGSDAFLECIKRTAGVVRRKTSAGYYDNYAHYTVKPPSGTC